MVFHYHCNLSVKPHPFLLIPLSNPHHNRIKHEGNIVLSGQNSVRFPLEKAVKLLKFWVNPLLRKKAINQLAYVSEKPLWCHLGLYIKNYFN